MRLRLVLPPNLAQSAPRDAIAVKLEIALDNGQNAAPEKLASSQLGELDPAGRVAAFSILQWCGGKLPSFLQLTREQLSQLVRQLANEPCFFWLGKPKEPLPWRDGALPGVTEHLNQSSSASTSSSSSKAAPNADPETKADEDKEVEAEEDRAAAYRGFSGEPPRVDGSTQYLAIRLPSREHPYYDEIRELLDAHRFKLEPRNRTWWLRDRHLTLNFLGAHWSDLDSRYRAEFAPGFQSRVGELREAELQTEVVEERNGFDVSVSIKAGQATPSEISQSLATGRRYVESDGKVYLLKQNRLDALRSAQRKLSQDFAAPLLQSGRYKLPFSRAPEVEEDLTALNPAFEPPATWRARSVALRDLSKLEPLPLSETLSQILRPYQQIGASWMYHLFKHDLGGVLADEMGLGKTLQALALIAALRADGAPSLVVCPASLTENWRREAAKFCPELRVFVNHGSNRLNAARDALAFDLVITSYGTLIRDQELLAAVAWRCVVGDEAQHIKNRRAQNAKAIASLQARGRILLTGTPIENSIQDLMSLLDFIMPGGWKPIPSGTKADERQWRERALLEQAAPYILRRTKQAVAKELPEKIEQIVFVDMTPEQRKAYDRVRQAAEAELSKLEESGASEGAVRMKTFAQLLRLRQTCCDPRLVDETLPAAASSKLGSFLELIEEAMDGGHRVLVFSQFVSLLSILREELESQGIEYCYLDGSTRNRMAVVDRFNDSDGIPLFLISLKAGGTGLNLTAADTVVHFDPWWNPAAEAQATDRAHRIGQTRVVTSYKLIVADSVEEKVLQLQRQKRQLLEDVFEASEAANAKISVAELRELI